MKKSPRTLHGDLTGGGGRKSKGAVDTKPAFNNHPGGAGNTSMMGPVVPVPLVNAPRPKSKAKASVTRGNPARVAGGSPAIDRKRK